jgi:hypothetical protein
MSSDSSRRQFLLQGLTGISGLWLSTNWAALLAAADHARTQAKAANPKKFEFFTPAEAVEIDAVCERILPADETPGAHDAGVIYFIDRALVTFAKDQQQAFRDGLPALQNLTKSMFPERALFSKATSDEQDQVLRSFGKQADGAPNVFASAPAAQNFFETVRYLTVAGFLIDPDTRGNPAGIGWKLIGRERDHAFQPPFGYYDKQYAGWQPTRTDQKQSGDA